MYKDKMEAHLTLNSIVQLDDKSLWFVKEFESQTRREYFVKLQNGCCFTYAKPDQLLCVDESTDCF